MFAEYRGNNTPALPEGYMASAIAGGSALRQGLTNIGEAIGRAREQRKIEAQKAGTLRKYLSLVDPDNKDTYTTAGLPDLEGALLAHNAQKAKEMEDLQKQAMMQAAAMRQQQLMELQRQEQQTEAFANQYRQGTAGPLARAMTPDEFLGLAIQNPYAEQVGSPLLRQAIEGGEQLNAEFIEDPETGMRFFSRGRTTLPSGVNPSRTTNNLPTVPGYTPAPTGRGGWSWLKDPTGLSSTDLLKSYQADLKYLDSSDAMLSLTPEDRAQRRKDIQQRIESLRAGKQTTATDPDTAEFKIIQLD